MQRTRHSPYDHLWLSVYRPFPVYLMQFHRLLSWKASRRKGNTVCFVEVLQSAVTCSLFTHLLIHVRISGKDISVQEPLYSSKSYGHSTRLKVGDVHFHPTPRGISHTVTFAPNWVSMSLYHLQYMFQLYWSKSVSRHCLYSLYCAKNQSCKWGEQNWACS